MVNTLCCYFFGYVILNNVKNDRGALLKIRPTKIVPKR